MPAAPSSSSSPRGPLLLPEHAKPTANATHQTIEYALRNTMARIYARERRMANGYSKKSARDPVRVHSRLHYFDGAAHLEVLRVRVF
jgi:hypothetical protein